MIKEEDFLKTEKWLSDAEIFTLLQGVSYIILAEPNFAEGASTTSHFTIFFNTQEEIPDDITQQILEKFAQEHTLYDIENFQHMLADVAFAANNQETPMPMVINHQAEHTPYEEGAGSVKNYIFAFNANFKEGFEKTLEGFSGWSYVRG